MFAHLSVASRPHYLLIFLALTLSALSLLLGTVLSKGLLAPRDKASTSGFSLNRLPLYFEPNVGQSDPAVPFIARTGGGAILFARSGVTLVLQQPQELTSRYVERIGRDHEPATPGVLSMNFVGANPDVTISAGEQTGGRVNYLLGNDPEKWHAGIPTYSGVNFASLYPGIGLHYDGMGGHLKGTYTLSPGANPSSIRWRYSGAQSIKIDGEGNLRITVQPSSPGVQGAIVTEQAPVAWQYSGGKRVEVSAIYLTHDDGSVGFALGKYDASLPLVIDPEVTYANYFGGTGTNSNDSGKDIALDSAGNAYVVGWTTAPNFPVVNPFQANLRGINDVFVAKLSPDGSQLLYATYLGGSSQERGFGIAVDSAGSAYVTGRTDSFDFPTMNPIQTDGGAFVTKLNPAGSTLAFSTYLGGTRTEGREGDVGVAVAVDEAGSAYVTGYTGSSDFPTVNAIQSTFGGGSSDAFVTRLNPTGSAFLYSTYLGGDGSQFSGDEGSGITLDSTGNIYVTGFTTSGNFPTANAIQSTYGGGEGDAFITKLNPAGSAFIYSTYLGGDDNFGDGASSIAADAAGNAYITGQASSANFPVVNAIQSTMRGTGDAFIAKLNPTGSALIYSTFLGGSANGFIETGSAIDIDSAGNAYVVGAAPSADFPQVDPIPRGSGGLSGMFLAKVNAAGSALIYSTFLPGRVGFGAHTSGGLEVDASGAAYVVGDVFAANDTEAFVLKISHGSGGTPTPTTTTVPSRTLTAISTLTPTRTRTSVTTVTPTQTRTPTAIVTPGATITPCATSFLDVHPDDYFYESVNYMYCAGIISGYSDGTFRPYNNTTRAQLSKIIVLARGWDLDCPDNGHFADVPPDHAFYCYIETAFEHGIITGYGDGTFRPDNNVTRGQLCKVIVLAMEWNDPCPATGHFADVLVSDPFFCYIETAFAHGIITGYGDGTFRPNNNAARGQICKVVYQAMTGP